MLVKIIFLKKLLKNEHFNFEEYSIKNVERFYFGQKDEKLKIDFEIFL